MKRIFSLSLFLLWLTFVSVSTLAQVTASPSLLNFQGRLAKPDGTPVANGNYSIRFSLWSDVSGGAEKWNQIVNPVAVRNGVFAVLLSGFPAGTFNNNLWLEIKIGADAALTPRQQLVSVAFAMKANTVPDGSIGTAQIANGAITAAKIAGGVIPGSLPPTGLAGGDLTGFYPNPTVTNEAINASKMAFDPDAFARVTANRGGVSNNAFIVDQAQYDISLDGALPSWQSFTPSGTGYLKAMQFHIGSTNGLPLNTTLRLYSGEGTGGTQIYTQPVTFASTYAPQIITLNTSVFLNDGQKYTWALDYTPNNLIKYAGGNPYTRGFSDYGASYDYWFITLMSDYRTSDTIYLYPYVGIGTPTPRAKLDIYSYLGPALNAYSRNTDGIVTTGSGSGHAGLVAQGFGGAQAASFLGDVAVYGNLSKSSGSFTIDHPLDPANKTLSHSFVESPDMMNLYNGVVRLDRRGSAVVTLPNWFEALNRDFRYQLTCIGGYAPVYVAKEVKGNRFAIAGGKPGMKVSWMVTGIRHDAYANARRIKVETEKTKEARGTYLFPEGHGQRSASRR